MAKKKTKFILAAAVIVAVAVLAAVLAAMAVTNRDDTDKDAAPPASGETITVEGEYECLPKEGDGPHTLECAFGLASDDGIHYGLNFASMQAEPSEPTMFDIDVGDRLRVTGTFEAEEDNNYDSPGTIKVKSFEEL